MMQAASHQSSFSIIHLTSHHSTTTHTSDPSEDKMSESEVKALAQDAKENGVEGVQTDAGAPAAGEEAQVGEKRKAEE